MLNAITSDDSLSEQMTEESESTKASPKKPFIEPAISVPIEVLEATTFFQAPTIESTTT